MAKKDTNGQQSKNHTNIRNMSDIFLVSNMFKPKVLHLYFVCKSWIPLQTKAPKARPSIIRKGREEMYRNNAHSGWT